MLRHLLIGLTACLAATPAPACRVYTPSADLSVLHEILPDPLPRGIFVAEIAFERPEDGWEALFKGAPARVRKMVQGRYGGERVIVRDRAALRIMCYDPIRDDGVGFLLGTPAGHENGVLVLEPIFATPGLSRRRETAPLRR
jgi:hypothetical protein